jgi:hypothetical protein
MKDAQMDHACRLARDKNADLSPAVTAVIAAIMQESPNVSIHYFGHERIGQVYKSYMISQVLDPLPSTSTIPRIRFLGDSAARILCEFGLVGERAGEWAQLYEHICGVIAAAMTIANRMRLKANDREKVRIAALLHDATKRRDVEKYGLLANSEWNEDDALEQSMRRAGYPQDMISAATNTGRGDRRFSHISDMRRNIRRRGVIAAIVSLSDARTPTTPGAAFLSLGQARDSYLNRKTDPESQKFFTDCWYPYYHHVEQFLHEECPKLDLTFNNEDIYLETIFPDVFGSRPSEHIFGQYAFEF